MTRLTDAEVKALLDRTVMRDYPSLGPWHTAGPALAREVLDARATIARLEEAVKTLEDQLQTYRHHGSISI